MFSRSFEAVSGMVEPPWPIEVTQCGSIIDRDRMYDNSRSYDYFHLGH